LTSAFRIKRGLILGGFLALLIQVAPGLAAPVRRAPDPGAKCKAECVIEARRALDELFNKQKYVEALQVWDDLYASAPDRKLLVFIAKTLAKLDRCEEELQVYRLLAASDAAAADASSPDAADAATAQDTKQAAKLRELETRCGSSVRLSTASERQPATQAAAAVAPPQAAGSNAPAAVPDSSTPEPAVRTPPSAPAVSPQATQAAPPSTPAAPEIKQPMYKHAWFWITLGGVAAAATAVGLGVGLGLKHGPEPTPGFRGMTFALAF